MSYRIDDEMIGNVATKRDVERMVATLREWGYDVEEGSPIDNEIGYIPDDVWFAALEQLGDGSDE